MPNSNPQTVDWSQEQKIWLMYVPYKCATAQGEIGIPRVEEWLLDNVCDVCDSKFCTWSVFNGTIHTHQHRTHQTSLLF